MASLLLFMAVAAIFFAGYATAIADFENRPDPITAVVFGLGGLVVGITIGAVIGMGHVRRIRGTIMGTLTGSLVGTAVGLLVAAPAGMLALLVGSPLLILYAVVVRTQSDEPSESSLPCNTEGDSRPHLSASLSNNVSE